jgi:hypothetical protein
MQECQPTPAPGDFLCHIVFSVLVRARFCEGVKIFLAAYAPRFYATGVGEFKNVSRHWKVLVGGGVVTLIVLVYTLRYHSSWPLIVWVILVVCLLAATFPAWRDKK